MCKSRETTTDIFASRPRCYALEAINRFEEQVERLTAILGDRELARLLARVDALPESEQRRIVGPIEWALTGLIA